jgi:DNA-binding SARP family transcriptional activator
MTELVEMTAPAAAEPRIAILGTVEITGTGRTTSLAGTNLPALLSMLALDPGRPVPNDRIIDALWPRTDHTRARRSLISLVHQLNATLGAHLGGHKAVVSLKSVGRMLRVDPATIDVVQFERRLVTAAERIAAGRFDEAVDAYEAALGLWRGDPFGGADLPYFVEPSARLRIARHRAEMSLIEVSLRVGRGAALVPWLMQRVDAEPFDERLAADAARALYQAGRSADALNVLRACMVEQRRRGHDVGASLRQLELDVLDHTLEVFGRDVASGSERGLDVAADEMIGRADERAALSAWLDLTGGPAVMIITGEAGVGKTSLIDGWLADVDADVSVVRARCVDDQLQPCEPFAALADGVVLAPDAVESPHLRFDRVVRRIVRAGDCIRLLVIDDAHWMTVESVALLRHVLWHPDVVDVHVVLVARSPEVAGNPALVRLSTDLTRAGWSSSLQVEPFGWADLDHLVSRHTVDGTRPRVDVDHLLQLTGGNPMFASAVLRDASTGDDRERCAVPAVVARVLGRFLDGLPARSRHIVRVAALLGDGVPSRVATSTGATELEVVEALDEVADGRLIEIDQVGGAYRFVHGLARSTVIASIDSDVSSSNSTPA